MTREPNSLKQAVLPDGTKQAYRDSDTDGETLVFLHGISSGAASWQRQFEGLGHDFRVLAWDAPGYGKSDALKTDQVDAQDYAVRLNELLKFLGIERFVLVGHSLGALIASAYAHLYPNGISRLVLANVAQGYGFADEVTRKQVFLKRPALLEELGNEGMAKARGPALVYRKTPEQLEIVTQAMRGLHLRGFTQASYLLAHDSIEKYLPVGNVDTHIVYSANDQITPMQNMFELAEKIHLSRENLHGIEEAGHLSYLDQPERFNRLLRGLIEP